MAQRTSAKTSKKDFSEKNFTRSWGRRILLIPIIFWVLFALLGYRAFELQVLKSAELRKMIDRIRVAKLKLYPRRGDIFDRNMGPLAISVEVDSIYVNPRMIKEKVKAAKLLAPILGQNFEKLLGKLSEDRYFHWLKRQATAQEVRAVMALGLGDAVKVVQEKKRFYPNGKLASHILGYTNRDGKGMAGIERKFDKALRGRIKVLRLPHDSKGRKILRPGTLRSWRRRGGNVVLTINKAIQYITERELAKAVAKFKAKRGMALVMDPNNGEILAMATNPDFDPNKFREYKNVIRTNWVVSNPYEPGSTFKPLTIAIAHEERKVRYRERMDCERGRFRIGRYTIRDDHPASHPLTTTETMKYSSNICTAKLALRLGLETFHRYLKAFGIGVKSGVDLPWESRGILRSVKRRWPKVSLANVAFGQGVAVTPLQLLTSISAIANGGILYRPKIVKEIRDHKGRVMQNFPTKRVRRVISETVARKTAVMMEAVVTGRNASGRMDGTGKNAIIKGIRVAGKTGTAQKPRANGRGYGRGRIGSFIGFLPVEKPRLAILVVIDEPKGSKYGGTVAAPAWRRIAIASLRQLGFSPDSQIHFEKPSKIKPPKKRKRR